MDEKKRKRVVYASLIGAIIFALIMRPWEGRKRKPPETVTLAARAETIAQPQEIMTAGFTPARAAVESSQPTFAQNWPRDPFGETIDPPIAASGAITGIAAGEPLWNLQGIMTVDGQPVCLLNGQTYKIGALVNGWELAHIASDGVRLHRGSQTKSLALP